VRFITTHGFWRSIALKASWILASSASTPFDALRVFEFGINSVTAAAIRASISGRTARFSSNRSARESTHVIGVNT
jgi:hypothetical protein